MTSFRSRPKFKITSEKKVSEIIQLLTDSLDATKLPIEGKVFSTHGLLRIKPEEQHYWSPQLSISFEETEDHKTIIRGMYGPHPSVWAIFLMGYVFFGLGIFFLTMIGLVRMSLKLDASILWLVPVFVIGAIVEWFMAQTGQKVGAEQTFMIHHFFEDALNDHIHISKIR
ncbi:hypothetical protein Emtol_0663 [Emticicia oligotrophica DSM 17448]|uniref:GTP-binding protein n=1 Tax=Emticicia oligotrophica (strain DSM 17448 / CIP 109782 / MTCC 6937 / GPTSA100-15) TaxID=929562 RepID=A0ABN4AEZ4_EMTOG|nr:hypothetical protein [Emticicia oligotrophica]AFK01816.1 hypothetical protein Emtol_0663 [Emticicia oligotrophica DSM 17448]